MVDSNELRRGLQPLLTDITTHQPGLWVTLCDNAREVLGRSPGHLADFAYVAFVVDRSFMHTAERAGYFAAQLMEWLESAGLEGHMAVSGFDVDRVDVFLRGGQSVLMLLGISEPRRRGRGLLASLGDMLYRPVVSSARFTPLEVDGFVIEEVSLRPRRSVRQALADGRALWDYRREHPGEYEWTDIIRFYPE